MCDITIERPNTRLAQDLVRLSALLLDEQDKRIKAECRLEEIKTENERLSGQIKEWSKANLEIVAKCSSVERDLEKVKRERDEAQKALDFFLDPECLHLKEGEQI